MPIDDETDEAVDERAAAPKIVADRPRGFTVLIFGPRDSTRPSKLADLSRSTMSTPDGQTEIATVDDATRFEKRTIAAAPTRPARSRFRAEASR